MKKLFILIMVICIILSGCQYKGAVWEIEDTMEESIIMDGYIIEGYKDAVINTEGGFGDYVDYCKYYYSSEYDEKYSKVYKVVEQGDFSNIKSYFENFKGWIEATDMTDVYDFYEATFSVGDYFLIDSYADRPDENITYGKFDNYSVYYYDIDTHILFYIHANI